MRGIALLGVTLIVACGGEGRSAPDVSNEAVPEAREPILPPDPPAVPGDPIAYRFVLGERAESDAEYVASPTDEGYALEARGADGASRWRVTATGARGDVHAQAHPSERGVVVMVRAESGDFVDLVDPESGRTLGRNRFEAEITRAPLEPPAAAVRGRSAWHATWPGRSTGVEWRGVEARVRGLEPPIAIVRSDAGPEPFWTFHDPYGCIGLAVVETSDALIAAQYCDATRGVVVHALSLAGERESRERWVTRPAGIDDDAHSTGANDIALQVEGDLVRVWGQEPERRYLVTLDLASGREIATILEAR